MKKQMEHFFESIQGWFVSQNLYREMVAAAKDGAVFVEIGAWKGRSTAYMGVEIENSGKSIDFIVIDHFKGAAEQIARQEPELVDGTLQRVFEKNIKPIAKHVTVYAEESTVAAEKFADASVDFIMIDGSHDYDSVLADLNAWWPKLKVGGVIAGDDYRKEGVLKAVTEFFTTNTHAVEQHGGKKPDENGRMKCWKVQKLVSHVADEQPPVVTEAETLLEQEAAAGAIDENQVAIEEAFGVPDEVATATPELEAPTGELDGLGIEIEET